MKKEIALVLPTSILRIKNKQLNPNDKLLFGLHYAYYAKKGKTFLTIVEMGKQLDLHTNIVSNSITKLENQQLIRKVKGGYEIIQNTVVERQREIEGAQEILIPFEVYNVSKKKKGETRLSGGAILLWAEYNKYRKTSKGYYASRETTAENIGSSKSILSKWTNELEERQMIERTLKHGRKGRELTIRTLDLSNTKTLPNKDNTISPLKQNELLPKISVETENAPRKIVKTYRELFKEEKKKESKKKKQEKETLKKELEREELLWLQKLRGEYDENILDF